MKKADADINLSIDVDCPHCNYPNNLLQNQNLLDDGYIYHELLPGESGWGRNDWGELVKCEDCKEVFIIRDVTY